MFYYEQKNAFGKWAPRTQPDERPSAKTSSGNHREIRNVQEVPVELEGASLGELERHFNPQPVQKDGRCVETAAQKIEFREDYGTYIKAPFPDYDAEPIESDSDGFRIEVFLHFGAKMINDDGTVFAIKQDDLLRYIATITSPEHFITMLAAQVHADNVAAGWWTDLKTGEDLHGKRNIPEMLMLIVSEISEAMEGHRKKLMDDKLPHRPMLRVELIDAMIRIFDLLGSEGNDEHPAGVIFQEKRAYNAQRADHKPAARLAAGGKAF